MRTALFALTQTSRGAVDWPGRRAVRFFVRARGLLVTILVLLAAERGSASTEINGLFDARSHGMGGTGVAFLDSAGAIPVNPALLDQIGKLTISVDGFFIVSQPTRPYTVTRLDTAGNRYQNYETIRSDAAAAVLPFVGGAYRLVDRVVLGVAAYPIIGQGGSGKYHPAPDEFPRVELTDKASMGLVEIGTAASVRVLDNLSLGAMWRINYMVQSISHPVSGAPNPAYADIDVSGFNFAGLEAGVFYKPLPYLGLGLSYRNKVKVVGTGDTTSTLIKEPLATESSFTNPHAFRAGLALSVLQDKLLLATDFKYLMYADAYKQSELITTDATGKRSTNVTPLHWKDSFNFHFGAEYKVIDMLRLRAGYILATMATNATYATQLMAPPGVSHQVGGGVGIKVLESLNVDLAAMYIVTQSHVGTATMYNAGVGTYGDHTAEVSLSGTYHM